MASTKSYMMARRATVTNYRFLTTPDPTTTSVKPSHARVHSMEFDESDIWGAGDGLTATRQIPSSGPIPISRKPIGGSMKSMSGSVPVNVPDWSKILRDEYKDRWNFEGGDEEGGDEEEWVPPHEYLARTRNASFSVQEGIGRTLKGRDLSRVRNAIWEKTGFQD